MDKTTNIEFDGKDIVLLDDDLNYNTYTVESILSNNLSNWKGWHCAIGLESLYIDYEGNVVRGTCREGGVVANIYRKSLPLDLAIGTNWTKCGKQICSCGADMAVPKVKNKESILRFFSNNKIREFDLNYKLPDVDAEVVYSTNYNYKTITWAVGRRCNFDCWYCPESDHNNYEAHKDYDTLMSAYSILSTQWIKGAPTKFSMLGGELTVYKDYLPFVKKLKEDGHHSITTTNGSHNPDYYAELAQVSDLCFSLHLNYVKKLGLEKFVRSIDASIRNKGNNFIRIRLMVDPGNTEYAKEVHAALIEKFNGRCLITVKPVHDTSGALFPYQEKEIFWIRNPT
jgi:pyruvate-formate lyase-activating enzyme